MKRNHKFLILLILAAYSLLYIATSYQVPCEGDCEKVSQVSERIRNNRQSYVYSANRCGSPYIPSDSICVYVKDTIGVDWNLLADSTCYFATQAGLPQQKVFIMKAGLPNDTLVIRQCP
jgi:hypothetical protein